MAIPLGPLDKLGRKAGYFLSQKMKVIYVLYINTSSSTYPEAHGSKFFRYKSPQKLSTLTITCLNSPVALTHFLSCT